MEGRHLGFPALAVSLNAYQHYDTGCGRDLRAFARVKPGAVAVPGVFST